MNNNNNTLKNEYHIRIKKVSTIEKLNTLKKLNKGKPTNELLNIALEYGIDILLDESSLSKETFSEQLEKNTRKIMSKINRFQSEFQKNNIKLQILLAVQEAMISYLMNEKDFELLSNNNNISAELKHRFFDNTPKLANDLKEELIKNLLEDTINEQE